MLSRPASSTGARAAKTSTLDSATLAKLHGVLLGHETRDFPAPWRSGFTFRERGLLCGLRQREGGPCGVLAVVQAFVLRELLRGSDGADARPLLDCSREEAGAALVAALSHIIWSARVGRLATVAGCRSAELPPLHAAAGELSVSQCSGAAEVSAAVRANIGAYIRADGPGVPLLLYSLALTRGLAMVAKDADFPTALIGANGYCSQELVNLLLLGRAHSNVFDGERSVGGDEPAAGGDGVPSGAADENGDGGFRLRGVPKRGLVGFLTLFERQVGARIGAADPPLTRPSPSPRTAAHRRPPHPDPPPPPPRLPSQSYNDFPLLEVGSRLKRPLSPIFVVQSESHYSVLWACGPTPPDALPPSVYRLAGDPDELDDEGDDDDDGRWAEYGGRRQLAEGEAFDLYYFDQMGERDEPVRLTLRRDDYAVDGAGASGSPLELVVLTRWPAASIDWNGEEVVL